MVLTSTTTAPGAPEPDKPKPRDINAILKAVQDDFPRVPDFIAQQEAGLRAQGGTVILKEVRRRTGRAVEETIHGKPEEKSAEELAGEARGFSRRASTHLTSSYSQQLDARRFARHIGVARGLARMIRLLPNSGVNEVDLKVLKARLFYFLSKMLYFFILL